jgi:uncharacterized membrane protein YeaQ/YmgE (transglycosylase-associated protein family)
MNLLLVIGFLVVIGALLGYLAGPLFGEPAPYGLTGDLVIGIATCVLVGLLDWFVIPALGFSDRLKYLGVAIEPAIFALLVLWLVHRRANA